MVLSTYSLLWINLTNFSHNYYYNYHNDHSHHYIYHSYWKRNVHIWEIVWTSHNHEIHKQHTYLSMDFCMINCSSFPLNKIIFYFLKLLDQRILFSIHEYYSYFLGPGIKDKYNCLIQVKYLSEALLFAEHEENMLCPKKLLWMSETISVHNMFSPRLNLEFSCMY